jgi:hypothetical protein
VSKTSAQTGGPLVLVGTERGITLIPRPTPLTRLNYFDGKFLRADDLSREQHYLRSLVELANRAGGWGVVHGFDTRLGTQRATLDLGPGLAIDPAGRTLFLPHAASVSVQELLEKSRRQASSAVSAAQKSQANGRGGFDLCEVDEPDTEEPGSAFATDLYLISIAHVEALCGEEDVYGKLCEDACVTSSQRPYRLEGVVVRAVPLTLRPGACDAPWLTAKHLRSRVAAAYFADERRRLGRLMSGARLRQETWCLGARAEPGNEVPLAVVAVNGDAVDFLDAWTVRRERMETPARRYWAWQMMMRPWNVYLAQVLQFQCQLRDVLDGAPDPAAPTDPCADRDTVIRSAVDTLTSLEGSQDLSGALQQLIVLNQSFKQVLASASKSPPKRILIGRGIIELPSAGYLPVVPGTEVSVNTQVRRLLGEGVDLRFCAVRPDFVAHALEEAQHMERICLLQGLEDPTRLEEVDILVPDGEFMSGPSGTGLLFDTTVDVLLPDTSRSIDLTHARTATPALSAIPQRFRGVGRAERLAAGGGAFHFAGSGSLAPGLESQSGEMAAWVTMQCDRDPFAMGLDQDTPFAGRAVLGTLGPRRSAGVDILIGGELSITSAASPTDPVRQVRGEIIDARVSMTRIVDGIPQGSEATDVTVDVQLELTRATTGESTLDLVLSHEHGESMTLRASWEGAPISAEAELSHMRSWYSDQLSEAIRLLDEDMGGEALEIASRLIRCAGLDLGIEDPEEIRNLADQLRGSSPNTPDCGADEESVVGRATLQEDTDIFRETNPLHLLAVTALIRLESVLHQPGFRSTAERLLFAMEPVAQQPSIRATRDWVLFHRRRIKRCGVVEEPGSPPPLPPPTAVRRYRLFHVQAPPDAGMEQLRTLIRGAQPIPGMAPVSATARFEGGSTALSTRPSEIENAWRTANPEERLVYGAIAAAGPAATDSRAFQEARLQQVTAVLREVTEAGGATFEVLDVVPAHLGDLGTEGAMVFVTASPCTAVRRHPADLTAVHAGVLSCFQIAFSGYDGHEGQVLASGLLADEFYATDTLPARVEVDRRAITQNNPVQLRVYRDLQRARRAAEHAAALFAALHDPTAAQRTMHAEVLNLGGFSYVLFAENYCSGVPHSTTGAEGTVEWGDPQNREELLQRARAAFDEALVVASAAGSAAEQQNLARVGLARTLANLGDWQAALARATEVQTSFEYRIAHSVNLPRQHNGIWSLSRSRRAYSVADGHGRSGLPFRSDTDPRVTHEGPSPGVDTGLAHFGLLKYPAADSPIVLASRVEARLIMAEAQFRLDNHAAALAHLNEVRVPAGLPALTLPLQLAQIFRERAFSLFATSHRLGDLRRLVRQDGRSIGSVYPSGPYSRPRFGGGTRENGDFGNQVSLPIPFDAENNPTFEPSQCNPTEA